VAITIVTFPDGSVITLAPGSEGKFDIMNGQPSFQLTGGTAQYSLKSKNAVRLLVSNQAVTATNVTGTLTMGGSKAAVGFWTGGHIAAVAVVGAAAAAGAGVAASDATSGGSSVSPSK
jgi:hypothetical protein